MGEYVTHESNLIIRLLGIHEPLVEEVMGRVQVTMPGAVVTIADAKAAASVFRAWTEAADVARRAFSRQRASHRLYKRPAQRVASAVLLTGDQDRALTITGRAPAASPSGVGQVAVRLGALTIVCDDRAAFDSQHRAWCESYRVAGQIWQMPGANQVAAYARIRADRWPVTKPPRR